jgi:hypothetical protein
MGVEHRRYTPPGVETAENKQDFQNKTREVFMEVMKSANDLKMSTEEKSTAIDSAFDKLRDIKLTPEDIDSGVVGLDSFVKSMEGKLSDIKNEAEVANDEEMKDNVDKWEDELEVWSKGKQETVVDLEEFKAKKQAREDVIAREQAGVERRNKVKNMEDVGAQGQLLEFANRSDVIIDALGDNNLPEGVAKDFLEDLSIFRDQFFKNLDSKNNDNKDLLEDVAEAVSAIKEKYPSIPTRNIDNLIQEFEGLADAMEVLENTG